jgi:hypothetical protein
MNEKAKQRAKRYRESHREQIRTHNRAVYHADIEHSRKMSRVKYRKNPSRSIPWMKAHAKERKVYMAGYHQTHKKQANARQRRNDRRRRREDPAYRLKHLLRCSLLDTLKKIGAVKRRQTFDIVGCTPAFLKKWIEVRFLPGMSWANHGDWEIDHVRPLATAETKRQVEILFHYTNLQPLWAPDNRAKWDRVPTQQELAI